MPTSPAGRDQDPTDPRKLRSRNRLLDAAASLLATGGIEAVTIDAVTRVSKVARTTLYRHFENSTHLLAATFERLVPPVPPPPATGSLRDRLIELVYSQATRVDEAPQLTLWAWLALGTARVPAAGAPDGEHRDAQALESLRHRIIEQYRQPFDALLTGPEATAELDEPDPTLALLQLIGPIVLAKITALKHIDRADCAHIVDNYLATHRRPA